MTPVPDRRLDAFRTFTLAAPLDAEATEIAVEESTAGMSTITGFFEHNSVVLHVDDELVTFSGFSREAPWRFTGVRRGAHGTRAASHARRKWPGPWSSSAAVQRRTSTGSTCRWMAGVPGASDGAQASSSFVTMRNPFPWMLTISTWGSSFRYLRSLAMYTSMLRPLK